MYVVPNYTGEEHQVKCRIKRAAKPAQPVQLIYLTVTKNSAVSTNYLDP